MVSAAVVWMGWVLAFVFFEGAALISRRSGDTLSEQTREWFKVHTVKGRITFGTVWIGFAVWFFWHILWQ